MNRTFAFSGSSFILASSSVPPTGYFPGQKGPAHDTHAISMDLLWCGVGDRHGPHCVDRAGGVQWLSFTGHLSPLQPGLVVDLGIHRRGRHVSDPQVAESGQVALSFLHPSPDDYRGGLGGNPGYRDRDSQNRSGGAAVPAEGRQFGAEGQEFPFSCARLRMGKNTHFRR